MNVVNEINENVRNFVYASFTMGVVSFNLLKEIII